MTIVLLHSSGLSHRQWRRLASELAARGHAVVAPDLAGHGATEPWPEPKPFSFHHDVARIAELVRAHAPVRLVGHSYGGFVAVQVALAVPDALASLAVYDPVAFGVLERERDRDARAILDGLDLSWGPRADDRERWLRTFVEFWQGTGAWDALREDVRAEFRRVAWVVEEGVRSLVADATPARAYAGLAMPVQLVTGEHSPLPARRVIERLAEVIPRARVAVIAGAGHMGPLTHAAGVNGVIADALAL